MTIHRLSFLFGKYVLFFWAICRSCSKVYSFFNLPLIAIVPVNAFQPKVCLSYFILIPAHFHHPASQNRLNLFQTSAILLAAVHLIAISTELDLYLTKHYTKGHQHGFKKWTTDLQFRTACAR